MTATALSLPAPTRTERGMLRLAEALTGVIERRIERRARRREAEIDRIRDLQTHRHRAEDVEHLLALWGVPRR
ncbi:hypothetical protein ACI3KS_15175 [Microbacterium sp. ZW T5_45]|uniref:hypothetical protein n=1 Tax=Microbacterium sp. ZW T5_45 TaxID=3378080 RepID=UPI0038529D98